MENISRPVWAEINLDNVRHNIREIKKWVGGKEIIAVIKADAYGHSSKHYGKCLEEEGVKRFAVATLSEAVFLRKSGIKGKILCLGFVNKECYEDFFKYNIELSVNTLEYAKSLSIEAVKRNKNVKIHLAIDTGMGRIGFLPNEESLSEIIEINSMKNIEIEGVFSHFSSADEFDKNYTNKQIDKFKYFINKLEENRIKINIKHISNSAGIIDCMEAWFDAVRPGIILYGYYPSKEVHKENISIKPVLTLKAKITHLKWLESGEAVSYGRRFITPRKSLIATIPIGYADGYTRMLSDKTKVIVNGKFAKVVGNICMDYCMIDVTDIEDVKILDEVILLGEKDGLKFNGDDIADILGTISYEVLCMIGKRVPRVIIQNGNVVDVLNYVK